MMEKDAVSSKELKRRDFILNGNLWKVIASIALPLFLYSCLNYVNDVVDNFMCAGISTDAVSASAYFAQIKNMISAIGGGLSAGGSILIAREIGKNNYKRARQLSSTVFTYTIIIALLTCAIVIPLAKPILRALGSPENYIDIGLNYFIINVITACLTMFNSVFMGVEKAKGSTVMITCLNVGVIIIKVSLTATFVYGMHVNDMTWVAAATLIANSALTIFIICRLTMKSYVFHYSFSQVDRSLKTGKKITFISFPIFLGKFIFSLGKVIINTFGKDYKTEYKGVDPTTGAPMYGTQYSPGQIIPNGLTTKTIVVGALGVSNNMGGMVTNGLSSIEDTESSVISQNIGAGNINRAIKAFYCGLCITLGMAIIGVGILSIPQVNWAIVCLFARNATTGVVDTYYANMISDIFFYEKMGIITLAINSAVLGLLYGFGYTRLSMIINIARVFVFRVPVLAILEYGLHLDYKAVGMSMGISNIAIGIVALITAVLVIKNIRKKQKIKEDAKMISENEKEKSVKFIKDYLKNFTHYKTSKVWCYEDGVVLLGAYDMYKATKDKEYLDFCIDYFDKNISEDGSMIGYSVEECNIDNLQAGTALFLVNKIHHEDKYDKALALLNSQLKIQPRTKSGSFWHKKRYPYQIWLDGLYMGEPFYALNAVEESSKKMRDDIISQFENVNKYNWDPNKKVFLHCYDETKSMQWADKENGRSPNVWLRSVGWLAMASADVYDYFKPVSLAISERKYLKEFLVKTLTSMEPYEDKESHCYYDLPTLPEEKGNYLETSGSVMLAYGYLKGARIGMLPLEDSKKGADILEGIIKNFLDDEGLGHICQVSGLDNERRNGSVEYYLSEKVVHNDAKGVGPFMMALSEYIAVTK